MSQTAIYRAFRTAGVPEELAQEAAEGFISADQIATKSDLFQMETRLTLRIVAISTSINAFMLTVAVAFIKLL